jgi:hypothetical protein
MSFARAGPRFLSFASAGVEMRWSAACEGPVDEKVPMGRVGQRCNSKHAMMVLEGVEVALFAESFGRMAVDTNRL